MIMKKIVLSAFGIFAAIGAFAQSSSLGFGIKAGVNFPKYVISSDNFQSEAKPTTNFHITGYLDAPLIGNFLSLQPAISLQGKGTKASGVFDFPGVVNDELDKVSQNTMWLEIPVNLVAKFPTGGSSNLFVGAGPYAAFGLGGKNMYDGEEVGDFKFGNDKDLKGTDFGVNVIGGYQFGSGFMIHGGYGIGLSNLSTTDVGNAKIQNRVWTVGIGFGL